MKIETYFFSDEFSVPLIIILELGCNAFGSLNLSALSVFLN